MKKRILILVALVAVSFFTQANAQERDQLLKILRSELKMQYDELRGKEVKPYMMSYRVIDRKGWAVSSTFGDLGVKRFNHTREFMPQIRLGDEKLDNFKLMFSGSQSGAPTLLPIDATFANDNAVRNLMWVESLNRYNFALQVYKETKLSQDTKNKGLDKAPSYSKTKVEKHYEEALQGAEANLGMDKWAKRLNNLSAVFKYNPNIVDATATISYQIDRRYFLDTEGREVVQNLPYTILIMSATIKAEDGMELPLSQTYFAYNENNLPSQDSMMVDANNMLAKLEQLRVAPVVAPYSGPALLAGEASGVFFHEIFGHRIEGRRMKNDSDGQTFKKMVGDVILPKVLNVYDDPSINKYIGQDLNGYYKFDDEGVRAQRVDVVTNGVLKNFLMTRTPIDGFGESNGHARGEGGIDPVSRQSNLVIETNDPKTEAQLRKLLIAEVKKQGKEFGYYFKEVTGGLAYTGAGSISSFNVNPLEVYKVYADGRADELVRGVDLIGTPLSMFANISHAGGNVEIFTGMCGAESGSVPVTAISPTILVTNVEVQLKPKNNNTHRIMQSPVKK